KSGLNLTKDEPDSAFLRGFYEAASQMQPMLASMGPNAVKRFAKDLDQEVFTGSSGRVFPKAMKASPLLRAWLARLAKKGVEVRTRWRWVGFQDQDPAFDTPEGPQTLTVDATILALGGASWSRLGSDGVWTNLLADKGVAIAPFKPANMGLSVEWSAPMAVHFGAPVKGVAFAAGEERMVGECVVSKHGLEGSGIYAVSRAVREGAPLHLDLLPGTKLEQAVLRLSKARGGDSMANQLRKALKLSPVKRALLMEFGRPLPSDPEKLARLIKHLPIAHQGPRPLDEAISVAGGVTWDAVDEGLMLRDLPGVFCAGEMLDWEAPTGGYLITGCLATGKWAGTHAKDWI
ncbi:unnamed protein product, partial [Chrysoparadoxa australica]